METSVTISPTDFLERLHVRLAGQLRFLIEADRLKTIVRGSRISDNSRHENTAEHSWHLALFALVLAEWAQGRIDPFRVVQMLTLHDLVEIECGDTPLFDALGAKTQLDRERTAADRLFGLLPPDQDASLRQLWEEFELAQSDDAKFAKAIDRLQPILLNHLVRGGTWIDYDIDVDHERRMTSGIQTGAPELWTVAEEIYADALKGGWLGATDLAHDLGRKA